MDKKKIIAAAGVAALVALLVIILMVAAREEPKPEPVAAPKPPPPPPEAPAEIITTTEKKLAKVASLKSVAANEEFQRNVQVMQARKQQAISLQVQMEQAADEKEKTRLKQRYDQLMTRLNADNQKMIATYGFSLTRNYTLVIEKSHVYMEVTDEEAAMLRARIKEKAASP